MKKSFKFIFVSLLVLSIAACGGSDSSTEESAAETVITPNGATVTLASDEATVDEVFEIFFNLGGDQLTGTIFWGDNTTTRVRGSGTVRHIYRSANTFTVAIQVDGQAAEAVATVAVSPAPEESVSQSNSSSSTASTPPAPIPTPTLQCPTGIGLIIGDQGVFPGNTRNTGLFSVNTLNTDIPVTGGGSLIWNIAGLAGTPISLSQTSGTFNFGQDGGTVFADITGQAGAMMQTIVVTLEYTIVVNDADGNECSRTNLITANPDYSIN